MIRVVRIWSCDLMRAELILRFIQLVFTCSGPLMRARLPVASECSCTRMFVLYRAIPGTREFGLVYIQRVRVRIERDSELVEGFLWYQTVLVVVVWTCSLVRTCVASSV